MSCSASNWWDVAHYLYFDGFSISLPLPSSPIMYGIISLHDHILFFLGIILALVLYLLIATLLDYNYNSIAPKKQRINDDFDAKYLDEASSLIAKPNLVLAFKHRARTLAIFERTHNHNYAYHYEYDTDVLSDPQTRLFGLV